MQSCVATGGLQSAVGGETIDDEGMNSFSVSRDNSSLHLFVKTCGAVQEQRAAIIHCHSQAHLRGEMKRLHSAQQVKQPNTFNKTYCHIIFSFIFKS